MSRNAKRPRTIPIQNPTFSAGFWGFGGFRILDRYVAILYVRPPTPQIFGFRILDFGALCSRSLCANFGCWISDFGFWKKNGSYIVGGLYEHLSIYTRI